MKNTSDVIVAGAGPAGSAVAILLARAGFDVLILDRAAFPRPKPCGDCLSAGAAAVLDRLGVLDNVLDMPHARLHGWRIIAPGGGAFQAGFRSTGPLKDCALAVERAVLDAVLLNAAIAAGAHFEQSAVTDLEFGRGNAVTGVVTREGTRHASLVIGADGLRSIVARRLDAAGRRGPLRKLSLTYHMNVRDGAAFGEMHVGRDVCAGLATVSSDGRCNLTIVADAARFGRAVARDTRAFMHAAIASLPRLRDRVPRADIDSATPLASGPFDQPVQRVAFDGAVLVGDAAGYYDPFTGQGVFQALAAAELLAPFAIEALRRSDVRASAFRGYVQSRNRMLRGSRLVQRGIETVLSRPLLADYAVARIRRAPAFAHAIMDVTGDLAPARALFSRRAITSLLIPTSTPENAA